MCIRDRYQRRVHGTLPLSFQQQIALIPFQQTEVIEKFFILKMAHQTGLKESVVRKAYQNLFPREQWATMIGIWFVFFQNDELLYHNQIFGSCFKSNSGINVYSGTGNQGIEIYPNPAKEIINISLSDKEEQLKNIWIYNALGQQVYYCKTNGGQKIQISDIKLNSGLVYCMVETTSGKIFTTKLMVNQEQKTIDLFIVTKMNFMKKIYCVVLFGLLFIIKTNAQINYSINFNIENLQTLTDTVSGNVYDVIEFENLVYNSDTGKPFLPIKGLNFIIPANSDVSGITINSYTYEEMNIAHLIYLTQNPFTTSFVLPDSSIYNSSSPFPCNIVYNNKYGFF
eukprot:TRINITY_DN35473_c0_g1_i2.p1 TRINITY_DN35473_c0_g1~~TRINITY_DN35473_c0_g1_i2.p1  ORF type:complete len:340 (-),score=28.17 TRINITY_DN35473_c0_g1_i2:111-1130(-)